MSEPPEQEEEPEDPAAGADLEELLEQFRELDEPPRKRANPLWVVSGVLLTVIAGWLALRASGGGAEVEEKSVALAGAMLPGKTSERLPREKEPVDVVEDYLARCKKGMTAQEVRWIVEDFRRAGLGEDEGGLIAGIAGILLKPYQEEGVYPALSQKDKAAVESQAFSLGHRQREWYGAVMAHALQLDENQRIELRANSSKALNEDRSRIAEVWSEWEKETGIAGALPYYSLGVQGLIGDLAVADYWIKSESYAPWELITLTDEQLAITRYDEITRERKRLGEGEGREDDRQDWMELLSTRSEDELTLEIPKLIEDVGAVLRFTEEQKFPQDGEDLLRIAQALHPAQLKLFLLLNPDLATDLVDELDKLGE